MPTSVLCIGQCALGVPSYLRYVVDRFRKKRYKRHEDCIIQKSIVVTHIVDFLSCLSNKRSQFSISWFCTFCVLFLEIKITLNKRAKLVSCR